MFGPKLPEMKRKLYNLIAERALRRGRKLTEKEKLENLEKGLELNQGTLTERKPF